MNDEKLTGAADRVPVVIDGEQAVFVRSVSKSLGIKHVQLVRMCIDWSRENIRQLERDKRIEDLLTEILKQNN